MPGRELNRYAVDRSRQRTQCRGLPHDRARLEAAGRAAGARASMTTGRRRSVVSGASGSQMGPGLADSGHWARIHTAKQGGQATFGVFVAPANHPQ